MIEKPYDKILHIFGWLGRSTASSSQTGEGRSKGYSHARARQTTERTGAKC